MGDKAALTKAEEAMCLLCLLPQLVAKPADALKWGRKIGFPLIIKAAFGVEVV